MYYQYLSLPSILESVFARVNLQDKFTARIKQLVSIVKEHAEHYDMTKSQEKILLIESILYSYDRSGKKSPTEDLMQLEKEIDAMIAEIQIENDKNKRWCGIARWLSCYQSPFR